VDHAGHLSCLVWLEFLSLPVQLWLFLEHISALVGSFICHDLEHFFNPRLQYRVCRKANLIKGCKEFVLIRVEDKMIH
jgi:hypothetical protein